MTVSQNRVRTTERVKILSLTTDVSVWQVSMIPIVKIVCIFSLGLFYHGQTPHTQTNNYTDGEIYYVLLSSKILMKL